MDMEASESKIDLKSIDNFNHSVESNSVQTKKCEFPSIRKVKTAPSPVISMYCNSEIVHITLDCGAEAPCIVPEECKRLVLKINPPNQFANSIDKTKLEVIGEVRTLFERGPLKLTFEALVIPKIDGAKILAGSPFFDQHQVDICYSTRTVKIGRKYSIPWSPSEFLMTPDKPATVVKIARTTVLLENDTMEVNVPSSFPSNSTFLVYPHSEKLTDVFAPQQVEAVGRTIKIKNDASENPLSLKRICTHSVSEQ